jgi:hypothetical protein
MNKKDLSKIGKEKIFLKSIIHLKEDEFILGIKDIKINAKIIKTNNSRLIATGSFLLEKSYFIKNRNQEETIFKNIKFVQEMPKITKHTIKLCLRNYITYLEGDNILNNNSLLNSSFLVKTPFDKKITIKDLCAEEKAKIGELLKKLSEEKEEKEKLMTLAKEERRTYEDKIEKLTK